jgi:K+ transporter
MTGHPGACRVSLSAQLNEPNVTAQRPAVASASTQREEMDALWRKRLYALLARNTRVGYEYFGVPAHLLLEVGSQVPI